MSKKYLVDSYDDVREYATFDRDGNLQKWWGEQDTTELVEQNKVDINGGTNPKSEFRRVASIPPFAVDIFCARNGITQRELWRDKRLVSRLVNDPDLSAFRTAPGRY